MTLTFTTPSALLSILMTLSLLLSGVHAKDVSSLTNQQIKRAASIKNPLAPKDDGGQNSQTQKVAIDSHLHNHIDKQTLKSAMKSFSDQNPQADQRSLRKVRHARREKRRLNLQFLFQPFSNFSL